jgi:hypothetical protein
MSAVDNSQVASVPSRPPKLVRTKYTKAFLKAIREAVAPWGKKLPGVRLDADGNVVAPRLVGIEPNPGPIPTERPAMTRRRAEAWRERRPRWTDNPGSVAEHALLSVYDPIASALGHGDEWQSSTLRRDGSAAETYERQRGYHQVKTRRRPQLVGIEPNPGPVRKAQGTLRPVKEELRKVNRATKVVRKLAGAFQKRPVRGTLRRRNGSFTGRQGASGVSNRMAAPAAVGLEARTRFAAPHREARRIFLGEIAATNGSDSYERVWNNEPAYPVSSIFKWLSQLAQLYQAYRWSRFDLEFVPSSSSNQAGWVGLAVQHDLDADGPADKESFMALAGTVEGSAWEPHRLRIPVNRFQEKKHFTLAGTLPADRDPNEYYPFGFTVAVGGLGVTTPVGELWVSVVLDLYDPISSVSSGPTPTALGAWASVDFPVDGQLAALTQTASEDPFIGSDTDMVAVNVGELGDGWGIHFTMQQSGRYLVNLQITGTTASTDDPTGSVSLIQNDGTIAVPDIYGGGTFFYQEFDSGTSYNCNCTAVVDVDTAVDAPVVQFAFENAETASYTGTYIYLQCYQIPVLTSEATDSEYVKLQRLLARATAACSKRQLRSKKGTVTACNTVKRAAPLKPLSAEATKTSYIAVDQSDATPSTTALLSSSSSSSSSSASSSSSNVFTSRVTAKLKTLDIKK